MSHSFLSRRRSFVTARRVAASMLLVTAATVSSPVFISTAVAQEQMAEEKVTAVDIRFSGPKTIAEDRLRGMIGVSPGQVFAIDRTEEDIRTMLDSGEVENVRVLTDDFKGGLRVIYVVETRSGLDSVRFLGNSIIETEKLRKQVEINAGEKLRDSELVAAKEKIEELYVRRGYADVSVTYRVEPSEREGYEEVTFLIDEGGKGFVRKIKFEGNTAFKPRELRDVMQTSEKGWLSFLTNSGEIDKFKLKEDVRRIEGAYQDAGYLRARVVGVERIPVDDEKVDLVIKIEEGDVYTVSAINVEGLRIFQPGEITPDFLQVAGTPYSAKNVSADQKLIGDYYGSRGYADSNVEVIVREVAPLEVSILYSVTEGQVSYVGHIDISGNVKTKDKVIRREVTLVPGDELNTVELAVSRARLMNTGYFSNVSVSPTVSTQDGFRDVSINVEEQNTGSVSVGVGLSSIDSIVGGVTLSQTNFDLFNWPNFTGGGQRFLLDARIGTERFDMSLALEEPYFLDRRLALGGEAYFRDLLFLSDMYDQRELGANLYLRKPITDFSYMKLEYTLQQVSIRNIDGNASQEIRDEEGKYLQSRLGLGYVLDTRDSIQMSRRGHKIAAKLYGSGNFLGGDVDDYGIQLDALKFVQLPYDMIFSLQGQFAAVDGDEVPIFDRLFLGGARTLRGFDYRDVGPKDVDGEPVGGQTSVFGSAELTFPMIESVRGAVFYDIGLVSRDAFDFSGDVNSNVGVGLRLNLPFGPLALDFGIPIQADEYNDSSGKFQFNMGYKF